MKTVDFRPILLTAVLALAVVAASGCARTISSDDQAKSTFHLRLARNFYNEHNIAMTQRELHEALRLDPSNADARFLKGILLMGMRDFEGAAHEYKLALQFKPDLREARNNLGVVLIELGNPAEALNVLKPLLEDPLYATPYLAYANTGRANMELGEYDLARKNYDWSVFLNPKFCLGYLNLGFVYQKKRMNRDAQENFEKAIRFCPDFGEPYYHLGVLLQNAGKMDEAAAAFEKCSSLLRDSPMGKRCQARAGGSLVD